MKHLPLLAVSGLLAATFATGLTHAANTLPKTYIVQLGDAPAGSYSGNIRGLAATQPAAGVKLDPKSSPVAAYLGYLEGKRSQVVAQVGGITVKRRFNLAFNGFSAQLTDEQARKLMTTTGVLSVTPNALRQPVTITTPIFLGLSKPGGAWSQLDAKSRALKGEDVIIGVIDTGVWPEDPSFSDKVKPGTQIPVAYNQPGTVVYGAPPAKWKGTCQTGPGFTADMCNNKLIGARFYELTHYEDKGYPLSKTTEFLSPRDGYGHGSHTASTAGGNSNVDAKVGDLVLGSISGMAPRARIAAYKVCWQLEDGNNSGCGTDNLLAAIDDAVADGVDVINFSISGSGDNTPDPVEVAFLNATAAGVFVAASAGNSGPDVQTVAHRWPWTTTVAASTHDRNYIATVTLGNGSTASGPSYPAAAGLPSAPLIRAIDAGVKAFGDLSPTDQAGLARCFLPADRTSFGVSEDAALDPAKVAGKIVVCQRGDNALVNKGAAVKAASGVGLVILNTPISVNTTFLLDQPLPAVHLTAASYALVWNYAASNNARAALSKPAQVLGGEPAPVMADFSSRGPNYSDPDQLKPDITAPGVSVIAAWVDTLTAQQHDQVAAGNLAPNAATISIDGTSMSSPHVAGIAALLKQAHPGWSPAAIKSAMMTSTTAVRLPNGEIDTNRFAYGAGHINPNAAIDTGLVYDVGSDDYSRYLCGRRVTPPAPLSQCDDVGSVLSYNLNLASLMGNFYKSGTFLRTVTNVGAATSTYVASASLPGWSVTVAPANLTLAPGQKGSFSVTVNQTGPDTNDWAFGSLVWSDGVRQVRSPLSVHGTLFKAPPQISDTRAQNVRTFNVAVSGANPRPYAIGLVPSIPKQGYVKTGDSQCFDVASSNTATALRFQLRNDETDGGSATDLGLTVSLNGVNVGSSQKPGSDEVVTIMSPAPNSTYTACVVNASSANGVGAGFKMSFWQLAPSPPPWNMYAYRRASMVYDGLPSTIGLSWSIPKVAGHYLGAVQFVDDNGNNLGSTLVSVELP